MENLALVSSKFPIIVRGAGVRRRSRFLVSSELRSGSSDGASLRISKSALEKLETQNFASISSSTINGTSQIPVACPPSYVGSPIMWIGVGVGLSALFSVRQAILQAFKTVMGQEAPQNGFNNAAFSPGSPFPFPAASPLAPTASSQTSVSSQPAVTVEAPATKVEAVPPADVKDKTELNKEPKSHESDILKSKQTPVAYQPAVTMNVPPTKVEAIPPTEAKDKTEVSNEVKSHDPRGLPLEESYLTLPNPEVINLLWHFKTIKCKLTSWIAPKARLVLQSIKMIKRKKSPFNINGSSTDFEALQQRWSKMQPPSCLSKTDQQASGKAYHVTSMSYFDGLLHIGKIFEIYCC